MVGEQGGQRRAARAGGRLLSSLPTARLERREHDLQASLGPITTGSLADVPIQAQMRAIDTELAERVSN
jgi:hypothetical protein